MHSRGAAVTVKEVAPPQVVGTVVIAVRESISGPVAASTPAICPVRLALNEHIGSLGNHNNGVDTFKEHLCRPPLTSCIDVARGHEVTVTKVFLGDASVGTHDLEVLGDVNLVGIGFQADLFLLFQIAPTVFARVDTCSTKLACARSS